jgi:hypothetical protein
MGSSSRWSAADVRTSFPEIVEAAEREGPQPVMRYGKLNAVIVSARQWAAIREAAKNAITGDAGDDIEFPEIGPIGLSPADLSEDER